MKKIIFLCLLFSCTLLFAKTVSLNITIMADGNATQSKLLMVNNSGYLVAKDIADALGVQATVDAKSVVFMFGNDTLEFIENSASVLVNNKKVQWAKTPLNVNNEFCIPLGFILSPDFKNIAGQKVAWNYEKKCLTLTSLFSKKNVVTAPVPAVITPKVEVVVPEIAEVAEVAAVSAIAKAEVPAATQTKVNMPPLYIYKDFNSSFNTFIPNVFMGDGGDFKLDQQSTFAPQSGTTCMKITYSPENAQNGWSGLSWKAPKNINLTGYKKLVFWIKGLAGDEIIDSFNVGTIKLGDSDEIELGPLVLTNQWEKYEYDIESYDLSSIGCGLTIALEAASNAEGAVFYLDEVYFV